MRTVALSGALLLVAAAAQAQAPAATQAAAPHAAVYAPSGITWGPAPAILPAGAQLAVLEGDPSREGPFVMRLKMPNGYRIPPHYHPLEERVTVIQGTFYVGMGERFDAAAMSQLSTGTYAQLTPGTRHFARAQGETVIQLHGAGPWRLIYVNSADDPRTPRP
jgi:quercetin dioxygenase-like cupin family protein